MNDDLIYGACFKEIVSSITHKGQVTIPAEVRKRLGIAMPDKVVFVLEDAGSVALRPVMRTLWTLRGVVPPLPGDQSPDCRTQIEQAMEGEAERIVGVVEWR